jgi:hypothetical protein
MEPRCPLCRTGRLDPASRELSFEGTSLRTGAWLCAACRETVLDGAQIERLRAAIRAAGLGSTDAEVDRVIERALVAGE